MLLRDYFFFDELHTEQTNEEHVRKCASFEPRVRFDSSIHSTMTVFILASAPR